MNRPFAVGDMLIIEEPSMIIDNPPPPEKYIAECNNVLIDGTIVVRYKSGAKYLYDELGHAIDGHNFIKTIRAPRHGSKEARDIVAMIYRRLHKKIWENRHDLQKSVLEFQSLVDDEKITNDGMDKSLTMIIGINKLVETELLCAYLEAKSMLQVQS